MRWLGHCDWDGGWGTVMVSGWRSHCCQSDVGKVVVGRRVSWIYRVHVATLFVVRVMDCVGVVEEEGWSGMGSVFLFVIWSWTLNG